MPTAIRDLGYHTAVFGKDHFGYNETSKTGVPHGFEFMKLFEGPHVGPIHDDYVKYFLNKYPNETISPYGYSDQNWMETPWYLPEEDHPTGWVGKEAREYIKNYNYSEKPLFQKVSFHRPHNPYDAPVRFMDMVDVSKIKPMSQGAEWDQKFKKGPTSQNQCCIKDRYDKIQCWCGDQDTLEVQKSRQSYFGNIKFVDEQIGTIIDALE